MACRWLLMLFAVIGIIWVLNFANSITGASRHCYKDSPFPQGLGTQTIMWGHCEEINLKMSLQDRQQVSGHCQTMSVGSGFSPELLRISSRSIRNARYVKSVFLRCLHNLRRLLPFCSTSNPAAQRRYASGHRSHLSLPSDVVSNVLLQL